MIDRATDAWGVQRVRVGRLAKVIINIATAIAYMASYLVLREASNDQWYLPAGLRFAALLAAPYRLWPALFFGDAAALASYRAGMIPEYGLAYYAVSSVAVWPVVALIVHQVRRLGGVIRVANAAHAITLLVAGLLSAETVSLINKAMSAYLRPGGGHMAYGDLIVYSLGHVQGIILAVFASVFVADLHGRRSIDRGLCIEAACSIVLCALMSTFASLTHPSDDGALMALRLCMLLPAVALTLRHGWRGAAVGSIAANVALFATIPHQDAGQADRTALLMQESFAFVGAVLFVLGSRWQQSVTVAQSDSGDECDARQFTRAQFESHERKQRETALRAEAMQRDSRDRLNPLVNLLRKNGQAEAAMNLVGMAHTQTSHFGRAVVDTIYPLTLERLGLFAAIESEAFAASFGGIAYALDLTGSPHAMSLPAKLAAYRLLGESIEQIAASSPQRISVRIHCSAKTDGRKKISMAVRAISPTTTARSAAQTAQLAQLRNRVMAFGGSLHNRPQRMRMIVLDDACTLRESACPAPVKSASPLHANVAALTR